MAAGGAPAGAMEVATGAAGLLSRLSGPKRTEADRVLGSVQREIETAWRDWRARSDHRDPGALAGAVASFEEVVPLITIRQSDVAASHLDADAIARAVLRKAAEARPGLYAGDPRDPDAGLAREFLLTVVRHGYARLLAEPVFMERLAPDLWRELFGRVGRVEEKIDEFDAKLNDIRAQPRDTLEAIALRFGMIDPEDSSLNTLRGFIFEKAKDYRRIKAQVAALEDREGRIANLKAAAEDAVRTLRLDEARRLIRDAITVQRSQRTLVTLREDAALVEAEAGIALLGGETEEAFRLLASAADSFTPFDRAEATERRSAYAELLYEQGMRFGGEGLRLSESLVRQALDGTPQDAVPRLRIDALYKLALILRRQGERMVGETGTRLLADAGKAYRSVLEACEGAGHHVPWAHAQNGLGGVLRMQSERVCGDARTRLLSEAADAYRSALKVFAEAEHSVPWAMTTLNLGVVFQRQGKYADGEAGVALLNQAVNLCRACLRVRTEADRPEEWAEVQTILGNTLSILSDRFEGEVRVRMLTDAVEAQRSALRVHTEAANPPAWATIQLNLVPALGRLGAMITGADGAALLREAVDAGDAALRIYDEDGYPRDWARAHFNLGKAFEVMAEHEGCADPRAALAEAAEHYEATLRAYDPQRMPHARAEAAEALARIHAELASLPAP